MKYYYCFITLLIPEYDKLIISEIVKNNYSVESGINNGDITTSYGICHLLILKVAYIGNTFKDVKDKRKISALEIDKDLIAIFHNNNIKYYSCIVSETNSDMCYSIGNIKLPKQILPSKPID